MSNMKASVIPYYDELENFGIILHKESEDEIPMKKFDWPRKLGHRQPSGGSDDAICHETISIAWRHNELWVKTHLESTLEAKSLSEKEFSFFGYFYAQLDGDVAYVPKSDEYDFLIIFCEKQKHDHQRIFHAIKFPRGSTVQIDAFVIHTIPIPIMDDGKDEVFNVDMYHRAVNAKSKFISPQNIHIHLLNIDQKTFIPLLDEFFIDKSSEPRLSERFTHKTLNLEEVNQDNFKLYGSLMPNSAHHIEKVNPAHWPYLKKFEKYSKIGPLEQDFRLSWSSHGHDDIQQLIFDGLSGTYEGKEGKPGIEYNPAVKEYVVNVLSTRPDGSYYLHAKHLETRFAMIFALPDQNNGDPIETTLKVFLFQNGQALSIHSNIWHSLPILIHPHTAEFHEVVCETNASIDINLPYECGSGLKFKYGL